MHLSLVQKLRRLYAENDYLPDAQQEQAEQLYRAIIQVSSYALPIATPRATHMLCCNSDAPFALTTAYY
jgi:hypothetical protein